MTDRSVALRTLYQTVVKSLCDSYPEVTVTRVREAHEELLAGRKPPQTDVATAFICAELNVAVDRGVLEPWPGREN